MRRRRIRNPRHFFLVFKKLDEEVGKIKKKKIQIKEEAVLEEGGDRGNHVLVTKERKL